jgi:hypothetical protein
MSQVPQSIVKMNHPKLANLSADTSRAYGAGHAKVQIGPNQPVAPANLQFSFCIFQFAIPSEN